MATPRLYAQNQRTVFVNTDGELETISDGGEINARTFDTAGLQVFKISEDGEIIYYLNTSAYNNADSANSLADNTGTAYTDRNAVIAIITTFTSS